MSKPFQAEEPSHRFVIGIDLGTTNSAVAYVELTARPESQEGRGIRFLEIPQLVAPGEVARRRVLPSFLYLPGTYDLPPGSTALPWDKGRKEVVGEFAREQGSLVPGRLVSSAKSWLAHGGVDRTAPILPWGEGELDRRVSPVEASAQYLRHIREAWNETMARGREGYAFEEQLVILTVPASFDEVARELTVSAAQEAGISRVILLEEPLAAFYAWLSRHESDWQQEMTGGQLICVCDVGGGTTDFTVIAIREGEKGLRFDRLAVGDHLMLGGDNMDFTLGRHLETTLMGQPGRLDPKRWHQLVHQCRKAKEELLGTDEEQARADIVVAGTGGKLIAGTLRGVLSQEEVKRLILDGFYPSVSLWDPLDESRRRGLTEWGLPYVQDPAVTRHLAAFWRRFEPLLREETGREEPFPEYLLFNGGALAPSSVRGRISRVVKGWFESTAGEGWEPVELENPYPDLAVAIGAAYYGLVRLGEGVRVGAGSPRSYFVEVAGEGEVPEPGGRRAVCLVPRGTEEGFETALESPAFEVLTNQPVAFQLLSSSTRLGDRLGDVVELGEGEISVFPPIKTVLRFGKKGEARRLPVQLSVRLTEVGTLELWCNSQQSPHRWQLQFDVRQEVDPASTSEISGETLESAVIERAQEMIRTAFSKETSPGDLSPERLTRELEEVLERRKEKWSTPLIRKLADALVEVEKGRRLTPAHEARWLNLLGFCLRPGYGDPLDEWRLKQVWKFYLQGLEYANQVSSRLELWVFLRRVSGGLTAGRQLHIYQEFSPHLEPQGKKSRGKTKLPKRLNVQEEIEIWMALASFERLPVEAKISLGRTLLHRLKKKTKPQDLWAVSRLGARVPLYGPVDRVIPGSEASDWLRTILSLEVRSSDAAAQAAVQIARSTGDRKRDVPPEERDRVAQWLEGAGNYDGLRETLMHGERLLSRQEQDWMFGESLPAGLLLSEQVSGDDDDS